jgi:hypothetical protein
MKAVTLAAYGNADPLEVADIPEPKIGPDDVMVRMAGASINPIDWKLRSGAMKAMMPLVFPAVLGHDASGEVVSVGTSVSRLKVGARVMGLARRAFAEYVVAPADAWAEVPEQMDLIDAAAFPLILLTGAQLIEEAVRPREGDVIVVLPDHPPRRQAPRRARARGRSGEARHPDRQEIPLRGSTPRAGARPTSRGGQGHPGRPGSHARLRTRCRLPTPLRRAPVASTPAWCS